MLTIRACHLAPPAPTLTASPACAHGFVLRAFCGASPGPVARTHALPVAERVPWALNGY